MFHAFQKSVGRFPKNVFLYEIASNRKWTYEEVHHQVCQQQNMWKQEGLRPRHRVLISHHNSVPFVKELLAAWGSHCVPVPISPDLSQSHKRHILDLVRPWKYHPSPVSTDPQGLHEDLACILFTSGTTNRPKGVLLTSANLHSNLNSIGLRIPNHVIHESDHSYAFLPWYHSYGFTCELLFLMSRGACIMIPGTTNPRKYMSEIQTHSPTLLFTVPRFLEKIKSVSQEHWLPYVIQRRFLFGNRLRLMSVGGAKIEASTISFYDKHMKVPVVQGYGFTEASPMISLCRPFDTDRHSCGYLLSQIHARINTEGILECKGPNITQGYLGEDNMLWRPREKFTKDGWFCTGDAVTLHHQKIMFQERREGCFKLKNGKFVDADFIEKKILEIPGIEQAALLGNHQESTRLVIYAPSMIPPPTLAHIQHRLGTSGLQSYEIPQRVDIIQEPFTVENDQLTLKMQPKRHVLEKVYP